MAAHRHDDALRDRRLDDDFNGRRWVATYDLDGWPFSRELKDYCAQTGLDLSAFFMDLRFDLMD